MATILWKDGVSHRFEADRVQLMLANGYTVTPEVPEVEKTEETEPVIEEVETVTPEPVKKGRKPKGK
ncbi:MAG: hypothetical protein HGA87_00955 [Desulfobulbaceae bacterium]|nr:hypothetical protein [Desulfobulbaceae bacterium]